MMMRAKQGRIVRLSTVGFGVHRQLRVRSNYTAAKAGMVGMTKTAAKELGCARHYA